MASPYFPPLPRGNLIRDELKQWLQVQTISAQKIITGSLQANQTISSSNFVAGTSGWQIDGDGNAEFNDVVVRGDIESGNWDGASPANLATRDGAATAGFYLDSSVGAAQFEGDIWLGGSLEATGDIYSSNWDGANPANLATVDTGATAGFYLDGSTGSAQFEGDIFLGGELSGGTITGPLIRTAESGTRMEVNPSGSLVAIDWYEATTNVAEIRYDTSTDLFFITGRGAGGVLVSSQADLQFTVIDDLILTAGGSNVVLINNDRSIFSHFLNLSRSDATISAGAITAIQSYHRVDTEAAAASDDLDTINGGADGDILILQSVTAARDVTVKDSTGNIRLSGDFLLSTTEDKLMLINVGGSNWHELSRSDNS